jgi:plasmid maintenance system antidote protein VapI
MLPIDTTRRLWYFVGMKQESIVKVLRQAIIESGYTQNKLSELSGVNRAQINRFVRKERTLTLESAAKIAEVLGLELVKKGKVKK